MARVSELQRLTNSSTLSSTDTLFIDQNGSGKKYRLLDLFDTITNTDSISGTSIISGTTDRTTHKFKGIKSANSRIVMSSDSNDVIMTLTESAIDLSNCDNTSSGFITSVNLASDTTGTLGIASGGTGATTLADGGILLGSGTGAITAMAALAKGSIVAGDGTTDPTELSVGTNGYFLKVDNTTATGLAWAQVTLGAATMDATLDMDNNAIDLGTGWISGDGSNEGINIDNTGKVFIGDDTPTAFFDGVLNVDGDIRLKEGSLTSIKMNDTSGTPAALQLVGSSATSGNTVGGNVLITAGDSSGSGVAGSVTISGGGHDGSGTGGDIIFNCESSSGTLQRLLTVDASTENIVVEQGHLTFTQTDKGIIFGNSAEIDNDSSGIITLTAATKTVLSSDLEVQGGDITMTNGSTISSTSAGTLLLTEDVVKSSAALQAATSITATLGNITATDGDFVITAGDHGIIHTNRGAVTQATGHTNGVTLNTTSGIITLAAVSLASGAQAEFTVTNSTVQADSLILLTIQGATAASETDDSILIAQTASLGAGSFKITLSNVGDSATDTNARKIHFLVINNS